MSSQDRFQVALPDGSAIGKQDTVFHIEHGAMRVDTVRVGPHHKTLHLISEQGPAALQLSGEELREQWGERVHFDPARVEQPRAEFTGMNDPDGDHEVSIDIVVEAEDFQHLEVAAMYVREHASRVLKALSQQSDPDQMDPAVTEFDWDGIHAELQADKEGDADD